MSRCLPFPTPEFANTQSYQTALVELIKLRKEKEKAKRMETKNRKLQRKVPKKFVACERVEKCELNEQWEKSDITEEHDQQTSSYSSDSPQSGKKRKQLDNSVDERESQSTEFLFRLPSKHRSEGPLQLSTLERTEAVIRKKSSKIQREEAIYRTLFEKWVPPRSTIGFGDEEWLFERTNQPQTRKESVADSCSRFSARARYLPEVDTWALPYTVLF